MGRHHAHVCIPTTIIVAIVITIIIVIITFGVIIRSGRGGCREARRSSRVGHESEQPSHHGSLPPVKHAILHFILFRLVNVVHTIERTLSIEFTTEAPIVTVVQVAVLHFIVFLFRLLFLVIVFILVVLVVLVLVHLVVLIIYHIVIIIIIIIVILIVRIHTRGSTRCRQCSRRSATRASGTLA